MMIDVQNNRVPSDRMLAKLGWHTLFCWSTVCMQAWCTYPRYPPPHTHTPPTMHVESAVTRMRISGDNVPAQHAITQTCTCRKPTHQRCIALCMIPSTGSGQVWHKCQISASLQEQQNNDKGATKAAAYQQHVAQACGLAHWLAYSRPAEHVKAMNRSMVTKQSHEVRAHSG
jgi:hypothetical protein